MLEKLDRPLVWRIFFGCFFAGFGFAVGEAVQRVKDGNYSPLFHPVQAVAHAKRIVRAMRMAARGFKPLRRPVATTEQRSA